MKSPLYDDNLLRLLPLGGLGEIGMNMLALETQGKIVVIDCGLMFPEAHMLGIDLVLPDVSALLERRDDICAMILTHGHEDHIGALPFLYEQLGRPPLYATAFTLALVHKKLAEFGLDVHARATVIEPRQPFVAGPFTVEPFRVAHSVPDGVGLALRCAAGLVVHSGDFKLDPTPLDGEATDVARLAQLGEEGVLLLLADSTNAEQPGYTASERCVGPRLQQVMAAAEQMVFVATFSSNIHRIQQAVAAARNCGRKILFYGRSIVANTAVARLCSMLHVADEDLITLKQLPHYRRNEVTVITTGSQGETRSALTRIAAGEHPHFTIEPDDCVILSSRFIPGNEKAINAVINQLYRAGADVHYQHSAGVHVSGHASREELLQLLHLVKPRYFVPIHGEYRQLAQHARLARSSGISVAASPIVENGQPVLISATAITVQEAVESGRVLVDGKGVGDVGTMELRDRHRLARHGTVLAILAVNRNSGAVIHGPELVSRGCIAADDEEDYLNGAAAAVNELLAQQSLSPSTDWDAVRVEIRLTISRFFKKNLQRRPLVLPIIIQL